MNIRGVEELERRTRRMAAIVFDVSHEKTIASCRRIVARAKALAPSRTGELRSAITYATSKEGTKGYIGIRGGSPAAVYWRFVEFGTVHAAARPYFRPAAEADKIPFVEDMRTLGPKLERG